jgi:hypothetical protein
MCTAEKSASSSSAMKGDVACRDEQSAGSDAGRQKRAPIPTRLHVAEHRGDPTRLHVFSPLIRAAACTAARMRPYVPQRHRLPAIAASMSRSEGSEFRASSAAAVMICPAWQ